MLKNFTIKCVLRDIHEEHLSLEKADNQQSNFTYELQNFEKGTKAFVKKDFFEKLNIIT